MNLKQNKGVSLISLAIAIMIIMIVANVLIYSAKDGIYIKNLENMYTDISNLRDKVSEYYSQKGDLPVNKEIEYTDIQSLVNDGVIGVNDTGEFRMIELSQLDNLTLYYGRDYEDAKYATDDLSNFKDLFIINEISHNIFYVNGVTVDEKKYYTDQQTIDTEELNLKYIEGIKIPDGYYYIGKDVSSNIVISSVRGDIIDSGTGEQLTWVKVDENITDIPSGITVADTEKDEFICSVNGWGGYFKNADGTVIKYSEIDETLWSPIYDKTVMYKDRNGDIAYIPKGFSVSLSPTMNVIKNGLVIQDEIGNQFVWIPVDGINVKLSRYTFDENGIPTAYGSQTIDTYYQELATSSYGNTTAKNIKAFKSSVEKYDGYFIARYEASKGTDGNVASKISTGTPATSSDTTIEEGMLWTNITQPDAATACQNMYDSNYGITSDLMNSYAWDTALMFIQKNSGYDTYSRKIDASGTVSNTGTTQDVACNVYDMSGNRCEWTTETFFNSSNPCVYRGGLYNWDVPYSSYRSCRGVSDGIYSISFRPILYITVDTNDVSISEIELDNTSVNLGVGKNLQITATINEDATEGIVWTSSSTSVATVDSSGLVTGVSAGKATITAKSESGGVQATCTVTVKNVITFTVSSVEYEALEGMTWSEWLKDLTYNTNGFYAITTSEGDLIYGTSGFLYKDGYVQQSDEIQANVNYDYTANGGGSND